MIAHPIEDRIQKLKDNQSLSITESNIQHKLSLRKNHIFTEIMKKRQTTINTFPDILKNNKNRIPLSEEELITYHDEIDNYVNLSSDQTKMEWIFKELIQQINQTNLTVNLLSPPKVPVTGILKFYIFELNKFTQQLSETQEEGNDSALELNIPCQVINNLITIIFVCNCDSYANVNIWAVCVNILVNFSSFSKEVGALWTSNYHYFNILINASFIKDIGILNNILLLVFNVFADFPDKIEYIIQNTSLIFRWQEILVNTQYKKETCFIHTNTLDLIEEILKIIDQKYFAVFKEFLDVFYWMLSELELKNKEKIKILQIIYRLTMSDDIWSAWISHRFGWYLMELLKWNINDNENEGKLLCILGILGNIFYESVYTDYYWNENILHLLENVLKTHMNSANEKDYKIIHSTIHALNNISGGTINQINTLIISGIPKLVMKILKIKSSNNNIYYTVLKFFVNVIECGDNWQYIEVIKLDVFKLFYEGLKWSSNPANILWSLQAIHSMFVKNKIVFSCNLNLKTDTYGYLVCNEVELLCWHKNQEIADMAKTVLEFIQDD